MFRNISIIIICILFCSDIYSFEKKIIVASTTSTYDTGLLTYINDFFENKYNIKIQVLPQGTGQAIRTAKDGNVEVLLVHHKESEIKFMNEGYGLIRYDLMYNDFIVVGPKSDFNICENIKLKLRQVFDNNLKFISRGDDSGTHKKEIDLWHSINLDPKKLNSNYLKVGQGMGNTLLITNQMNAYTIVDRGTWISFNHKDNLKIICENQPPLFNQYGLILINPKINNKLNFESAKFYVNWLLTEEAKFLINSFKKNNQQLFFYNYH